MWLSNVTLENIKCFEKIELSFAKTLESPYRWITLLGENGVGKSTILQAIGLLLAGPEAAKELLPRPTGWVRNTSHLGKLIAYIRQENGDQGKYSRKQKKFSYTYFVTGDRPEIPLSPSDFVWTFPWTMVILEENTAVLNWLRANAFASNSKGWFAAGYGSFRRLTRENKILIPSLSTLTRASNFSTQFDESSPLSSFEQWIVHLDYRLAKDKNDEQAQKMWQLGTQAIAKLLPKNVEFAGITDSVVYFLVQGQKVPTANLSDGYRSVIAFAGDLIWRLLQAFPDMADPTQATGIVLIDELDIHLHPTWQRDIAGWLRTAFPNLQFIVATHGPLVAIGAGEDALTLRFKTDEHGIVNIEPIDNISTYDVDQVLKSPAFDLVSNYSPQTQQKIEQYHQLRMRFDDLDDNERKLFAELTKFMREIQLIETPPEPGSLLDRMNRFLEENLP